MPDPRPIRATYDIVNTTITNTKNENAKNVVDYASRFQDQCMDYIQKITNWDTVEFDDALSAFLMVLSYGISENGPNKKELANYLKKESTASISLFKFIRDGNGQQLGAYLLKEEFANQFKKLFKDPKAGPLVLKGISTKLGKLRPNSLTATEKNQIETLIDCIISGTDKS